MNIKEESQKNTNLKEHKIIMKKLKRQVKGITLIALVVTIIVLLILAGVAINLTVGDNGLFRRAQNAADTWQMAEQNEQSEMDEAEEQIDKYMPKVVDGVTIPYGFYYVGGAKDTGLIISDNTEDENKYSSANWKDQANIPSGSKIETGTNGPIEPILGNQFVWVPVENANLFKRYDGYIRGMLESDFMKQQGTSNYWELLSEPYSESTTWEATEYSQMYNSVISNKGFYVARFEASKGLESKAESKPGVEPWRYIEWGNSMTEIGTEGAVYRSQNMYTDKNNYAVTSTLIYGTQWDAIMTWIDADYPNKNCKINSIVVNSDGYGNCNTGSILPCGSSDSYRIKNIYDLAGNMFEWTMETYSTNNRVRRGGYCDSSGLNDPVSVRYYNVPETQDNLHGYIGFRVALYL